MTQHQEAVERTQTVMAVYRTCDQCGIRDRSPAVPDVLTPPEGWISGTWYTAVQGAVLVDFCSPVCARDYAATVVEAE